MLTAHSEEFSMWTGLVWPELIAEDEDEMKRHCPPVASD
jgi:hypothetical protein